MDSREPERRAGALLGTAEQVLSSPRSTQERLQALLCHGCAVHETRSIGAVHGHALDALVEVFGADRGALAVVDPDGVLRVKASGGLNTAALAAIEGASVLGSCDTSALITALQAQGLAGAAVWKLEGIDAIEGLLVACYDQPHTIDDDERQMAEIFAAQLAQAIGRSGAEAADRLSHAHLRGVLDATGEGIIVRGNDRKLLWANAEAARILGVSSVEDLLATSPDDVAARYDVFDPEGFPVSRESFPGRRALETRDRTPVETIFRYRERASGSEHWATVRAQELVDARGDSLGVVTVFRDITKRQEAVLERDASEARLDFLASLGPQLLAASLDSRGLLERVAELVVPRLADYCSVREVHADGTVARLAVRHADPSKAELLRRLEAYPPRGQPALPDSLIGGSPVLVSEITEEQLRIAAVDEEHLALMKELNPRSVLAVPVQARGRTLGVILLVAAESGRRYGQTDVMLAEDLARRAGLAIDNTRLYEEEQSARAQGEQTRAELALLLEVSQVLAASLDYEQGLVRLAHLASSNLCDLCLIDLLDPSDGSIRRVAAATADPDQQPLADILRTRYPPTPDGSHPAVLVIASGKPQYAPVMEPGFMQATTRDPEHHRITRELGFRSYVSVPLSARGRILGALTLIATTRSGRTYREQDVTLAAELARRAALSLDNVRLYQQTELQKALLTSQSEAAIEGILVVSADGAVLSYNRQFVEMWSVPEPLLKTGDADALLRLVTTMVEDPDAFAAKVQHLRANRSLRARDEIRLRDGRVFDRWSAPLTGEDGVYRGRAWYFRDVSDLKHAQEERGRLYEAERLARLEADRSRSRLGFLLEASTLFAGHLEVDTALKRLADLVVGSLADMCVIDLVAEDGRIIRSAAASNAEGSESRAGGNDAAAGVIRSRRPLLVPDVRDAPPRLRQAFMGTNVGSYLGIPLLARPRVMGCLSLALSAGGLRRYGPDDLELAQELGRRVALALDHARLFDAQRHIARTLQASLLPPGLPEIPGVEIAPRYRAASATSEVGGDFYDVFASGGDAWTVAMGDISGKGVEAASLTALARYTVRAAAREHRQPREILLHLNEAVIAEHPSSRFLTIALGRLRWRAGVLRMTVACGGHPPPLLLRAQGKVERAGRPGTLIGFLPTPELPEKVTELKMGDVALFYTDGLTDVRGSAGTFGEERLAALLRQCQGLGAEEIAGKLEDAVVDFQAGEPRDDLAMLVLRVVGPVPSPVR